MQPAAPAHFETLLARLAAAFGRAPAGDLDAAIDDALLQVSETLRLDRADLTQAALDSETITVTHSYAGDRPPSRAAGGMRRWAQAGGVRSHVTVPVVVGDEALGGLHVATLANPRRWSEDDLRRLELLAAVFADALERRRHEAPGSERLADVVARAHPRGAASRRRQDQRQGRRRRAPRPARQHPALAHAEARAAAHPRLRRRVAPAQTCSGAAKVCSTCSMPANGSAGVYSPGVCRAP